jgi:hypothetical protein
MLTDAPRLVRAPVLAGEPAGHPDAGWQRISCPCEYRAQFIDKPAQPSSLVFMLPPLIEKNQALEGKAPKENQECD